jgi:hypothetical protein
VLQELERLRADYVPVDRGLKEGQFCGLRRGHWELPGEANKHCS